MSHSLISYRVAQIENAAQVAPEAGNSPRRARPAEAPLAKVDVLELPRLPCRSRTKAGGR